MSGFGKRRVVEITQEVINVATPKNSGHCMIADAIKEQFPEAKRVSVDLQSIRWSDDEKGVRYVFFTPAEAQRKLLDFDQGKVVEPFTFSLRAPAQVVAIKRDRPRATDPDLSGPAKAKRNSGGQGGEGRPTKIGGEAPPLGALANRRMSGQRREHGLRSMAV